MAKGLKLLELAKRSAEDEPEKVGIFAANCHEWSMTWLAMQRISSAIVTLYATLGESSMTYCVDQSELQTIACDEKGAKNLVAKKSEGQMKTLDTLITFFEPSAELRGEIEAAGLGFYSFNDIV